MAWRPHGKARVDVLWPQSFACCDRCGGLRNLVDLSWQMQWAGPTIINLRLLVCGKCLDAPTDQLRTIMIPADPPPVYNARPEAYALDETDYRVTEDAQERGTEDGSPRVRTSTDDENAY